MRFITFFFLSLFFLQPAAMAEEHGTIEPLRAALLVLPSAENLKEGEWLKYLEQFKAIKLTVALSAANLKKISEIRLRTIELMNEGKLEFAVTLSTPELSLPALETERGAFKNFCGEEPLGFVPKDGIINLESSEILSGAGFVWGVSSQPSPPWERGSHYPLKKNFLSSQKLILREADALSKKLNLKNGGSTIEFVLAQILNDIKVLNTHGIEPILVWDAHNSQWNLGQILGAMNAHSKRLELVLCKNLALSPSKSEEIREHPWSWIEIAVSTTPAGEMKESEDKIELKMAQNEETVSYEILYKEGTLEKTKNLYLYLDLNHRHGAGKVTLLGYENLELPAEDAWEYEIFCEKITAEHWNCQLLAAGQSRPLYVTIAQIPQDLNSLTIQIPKKLLGRDPLRWGNLVCIIDEENRILDILSSVENKADVLQKLTQTEGTPPEKIVLPMMRSQ